MKKEIGLTLFFIGIALCFYSGFGFTGFVVSQTMGEGIFFLGIILVIGGILLVNLTGNELEVKVYSKEQGGRREYYMTDPESFFGSKGTVSLEQFSREMREIKKDPELLMGVKEAYLVPLMKIANENGNTSELAKKYLFEMGIKMEEDESKYALPKVEIERIKNAFRQHTGNLTPVQREILKKYDLKYSMGKTHAKIAPMQGGESIAYSCTPSDWRGGRNNSSLLVKLCDKQYRKKLA